MTEPDLTRLRIDRTAPTAGRAGWWAFALLLGLGGAFLLWRDLGTLPGPGLVVELGRVVRIGGVDSTGGVSANGYVVARKRAALSTDIAGRLVELRVEEGDRVRAGDVIARLDTRQLEAALQRARAEETSARAGARLAQQSLDRVLELAQTDDASASELDTAQAEKDQADARAQALHAAGDEIQVMIDKSTVVAPFDGIIVEKNAEVGEVVSATGATGPSARGAVATLVAFESLEVQVELAQTSLRAARTGALVSIFLDAFPRDPYPGRVRQIWPTADRQKATVELRVEFTRRDERILPEMGCRVAFVDEGSEAPEAPMVLLPRRALVEDSTVFLFDGEKVSRRQIEVDRESRPEGLHGDKFLVLRGLVGMELVVIDPPVELRDGDIVTSKESNR